MINPYVTEFPADPKYFAGRGKELELNEREKKAVEFLKEQGRITLGKYIELNPGVTEKTSYRDLKRMEELGLIKSVGKKRGRYYVLV